jgi:cytochrome c biogenesis protein CcmG/thiol:disulfide interchange protein DsbE
MTDAEVAADDEPDRPRGRRWRRPALIGAVALVAVVVVVAVGARPSDRTSYVSGGERRAPTFAVPDLRDQEKTVRLADAAGRPVVLNFWASWCVPCRKEMPAFQAVHREVGDRVTFIGINHQDSRDDALDLLRETGVTYRAGFDPQGRVAQGYGLYGMPTTIFISPDGRIVGRRVGEVSRRELEDTIAELFPAR